MSVPARTLPKKIGRCTEKNDCKKTTGCIYNRRKSNKITDHVEKERIEIMVEVETLIGQHDILTQKIE